VRSAIVLLTTGAVILLDSGWWLAGAVISGVVLFAMAHHAEHRHSPYRAGWY
jgi:hypothetical protein